MEPYHDELIPLLLRRKNIHVTRQAVSIFNYLAHTPTRSASEIASIAAASQKIPPSTTYRILNKLRRAGLVTESVSNGRVRLSNTLIASHQKQTLICRQCGSAKYFKDQRVEKAIKALVVRRHYQSINFDLKISGICWKCRNATNQ